MKKPSKDPTYGVIWITYFLIESSQINLNSTTIESPLMDNPGYLNGFLQ